MSGKRHGQRKAWPPSPSGERRSSPRLRDDVRGVEVWSVTSSFADRRQSLHATLWVSMGFYAPESANEAEASLGQAETFFLFWRCCTRSSTTAGSASVEV